jgi:hypothetical protein
MLVNKYDINIITAALRIVALGHETRAKEDRGAGAERETALAGTYAALADRLARPPASLTPQELRLVCVSLRIAALGYDARAKEQTLILQHVDAANSENFAIACRALAERLEGKKRN